MNNLLLLCADDINAFMTSISLLMVEARPVRIRTLRVHNAQHYRRYPHPSSGGAGSQVTSRNVLKRYDSGDQLIPTPGRELSAIIPGDVFTLADAPLSENHCPA